MPRPISSGVEQPGSPPPGGGGGRGATTLAGGGDAGDTKGGENRPGTAPDGFQQLPLRARSSPAPCVVCKQRVRRPPSSNFTTRIDPILGRLVQDHREVQQLKGLLAHVEKDQERLHAESGLLKRRVLALQEWTSRGFGTVSKPLNDYESGYMKSYNNEMRQKLARTQRTTFDCLPVAELKLRAYEDGPDAILGSPKNNARRRLLPTEDAKLN